MKLVTERSLTRPEIVRWHRRIKERYLPPEGIKLSILLPCSAKKPYSRSKSHMLFIKHIKKGAGDKRNLVHEVSITSPLGLVPRELEKLYPAAHYDIPVTGYWTREEKDIVKELIYSYMEKTDAEVIAHVDGPYREICEEIGIPTTGGNVYSTRALKELERLVSEKLKSYPPVRIDRKREAIKKILDFQFGLGASKYFSKIIVKGSAVFVEEEQVATINPSTGYFALTLRGGELLKEYGRYYVKISFRLESSTIFGIGVEKADHEIRPNDEVVVIYEGKVVGVGRAYLSGEEMERAKRGLAVKLRHRVV
jgi:archaeosine synthase